MTRQERAALFILLALILVAISVLGASPADAGTKEAASLSGSIARPVDYHDFHYNPQQKPMGVWHQVYSESNPGVYCTGDAKWGNFPDNAFAQLGHVSGNACKWGGIRLTYYYDGAGTCCDGVVRQYLDGDYCVATPDAYQAIYCAQVSDGSIFMMRDSGPNATMFIISAEFVLCSHRFSNVETVNCTHDYYSI